ncbi:MAG: ribonuclease H-like domain-containing protein [Anaerolineales bacterium]|nr:ribonuclease H-like domain-containing protein [Anaerolineales bacterium]
MDSLSDRLKKLGIQVGAEDIIPPPKSFPVESIVPGDVIRTPLGESYLVTSRYRVGAFHGNHMLRGPEGLGGVSQWGGYDDLSSLPHEAFAFLDTETTGLSGGAGTLVFLVGIARFEGEELVVAQFFLRSPSEEPAMLEALEGFLNGVECLVTFNGKAFDLPLLQNRFITNGWEETWSPNAHLDLLHLARKLWKDRLPSRALGDLESQILGVERSEEEVPGWLVPLIYTDYLRQRDARPLRGVFYHNLIDILSMVVLLDICSSLLEHGDAAVDVEPVDLISMARLWQDSGELDKAIQLYESGMERALPGDIFLKAVRQLSFIRKREGDYSSALKLWRIAAEEGQVYACVEIAKYQEHSLKDLAEALVWTQTALELLEKKDYPDEKKEQLKAELTWREKRVVRKIGGS